MASATELIMGGWGTKKIGANTSVDNAEIAGVFITEDVTGLKLFRAPQGNETTIQDVTTDHIHASTSPKAGDLIKGFGYNFWKVTVGSAGAATLIYDKKK
jgi:hypothetical protein